MDTLSVCTNFEFPDDIPQAENSGNVSGRRKIETRKELRRTLKLTQKENSELNEQLRERNNEISELKESIKSLNEVIAVTSKNPKNETEVTNAASNKIVDLCRRNRQLKAELGSMKSKYTKLDIKLAKLEKEINVEGESNKSATNLKNKKGSGSYHVGVSVENLQEQLSSTKQKLFEALNTNTELKNNLKMAQKCLQQEIGDNVNLNSITGSNSNWRGRAQQILSLQHKVSELKERLEFYQNSNYTQPEDPSRNPIRKIEASRKAELDDLQNQVRQMQATIDQQTTKISALKARNKNLVDDATNYKLKTLNLLEQSDVNDNSIAAISEKLNIQKYHYEHQIKELNKQLSESEKLRDEMNIAQQRARMETEQAFNVVKTKEEEIENLNRKIKLQEEEMRANCGDFLFACRDLKKSEFLAILDSLESEKNSLIKLNEDLNERLKKNEEKNKNQMELISKQKIKISRLEAKIREHNKEIEAQQEKKKRNQRISDYSSNLSSRLSISAMCFENSLTSLDSSTLHDNSQSNDSRIDDLKNKIEFLNDKIEFLEEKMKILRKEKEDDLKSFNNIMKNSKDIVLNIIKNKSDDDTINEQCSFKNQNNHGILKNNENNQNNIEQNENETERNEMDNDSLENYHINLNYRDNDSITEAVIKSTAKFPTPKSSFTSISK